MQRMFLFHGPNEVLRRFRVEEILERFPQKEREVVYVPEKDPASFESHALSDFLFGEGQIYLLKNWDNLKDNVREEWEKVLLSVVSSDIPHIFILSTSSVSKKFLSAIANFAQIEECKNLYGRDIQHFIKQTFQKKGFEVESLVYEYLLDISHESLEEIDRMMAILEEAASKTKRITLELCQHLLAPAENHSIFDLIRGIFTNQPNLSLSAFRSLRLEGESLQRILAMVYRATRLLWSYKTKGNLSLDKWAEKVSISLFEARRIQEYDKKISQKKLSEWFDHIAYLEQLSKSTREDVADVLFEAFLLEG
ncbi:MAG: DNA polymerase III subunit delta [Brevinematales bacterium]